MRVQSEGRQSYRVAATRPTGSSEPSSDTQDMFASVSLMNSSEEDALPSSFGTVTEYEQLHSPPRDVPRDFS